MLLKDGTEVIEAESIYTHLVPTCSKLLKAGHITIVKSLGVDSSIIDILSRAGYKVSVIELDKKVLFSFDTVKAKILEEDCKLLVAIGEDFVIEGGKVIADMHNISTVLIPVDFSALCAMQKRAEFFIEKGEIISYLPKEPAVILLCKKLLTSQPPRKLSLGFGYILSYLVWSFDTIYESLIHNKKINSNVTILLQQIIEFFKGLDTLKQDASVQSILGLCIEISKTINSYETRSISANILAWLISLYKKEKVSYTNYVFIASYLIVEIYQNIKFLNNMLLSDRNQTLKDLSSHCGLDYARVIGQTKIGYAEDYNRRCHITLDYIHELQELIKGDWLEKAATYYRRLIGNSGYKMQKLITSDELLMLARLAGEECGGYPLIKHIALSGLLEKYI